MANQLLSSLTSQLEFIISMHVYIVAKVFAANLGLYLSLSPEREH